MIEITEKLVQKTYFPNLFDYGRNDCVLECQKKFIGYNMHLKKTKEKVYGNLIAARNDKNRFIF